MSDFLLSLADVEVVVLYAKRKGGYKFSIRSERADVHGGDLANQALSKLGNGGGHVGMAGGFAANNKLPVQEEYFYDAVQSHFIQTIREMYPQIL